MYGENATIVQCSFGACLVRVWCIMIKTILKKNNKQAKLEKMSVILSNREAALVHKMVLKPTLF